MNLKNRESFRDLVLDAMARKSWSAARVAKEAGISQSTMTRITRAETVQPQTVGKVREILGISSLAQLQNDEGYSMDIELVRDAIGLWLRDVPVNQRAEKVRDLFAAIAMSARKENPTV